MNPSADAAQPPSIDPTLDWRYFIRKVKERTGIDLECYKPEQMRRRLSSLMLRCQARTFSQYFGVLDNDPDRLQEFKDFFTINVSEFFRDAEKFDQLRTIILPEVLKSRRRLRIWSAGCSYGAEPFSVAMILAELTPTARHAILGTDIDQQMVTRAQLASSFSEHDLQRLPGQVRARYFAPSGNDRYALDAAIRNLVTFKVHDLLKDPYENDFDLILCRNVTIYFTEETKRRIYRQFQKSLRHGGFLFVGGTEMLHRPAELGFQPVLLDFYRKPMDGSKLAH